MPPTQQYPHGYWRQYNQHGQPIAANWGRMMYGLPSDLDLGFLIGPTLLQVCIGENEVILRFDAEVSITIESSVRVRDASGHEIFFNEAPSAAASLVAFLSDSVADVFGHRNGTLRILFTKGGWLEIYDSSTSYESYQIQHGAHIYVV